MGLKTGVKVVGTFDGSKFIPTDPDEFDEEDFEAIPDDDAVFEIVPGDV